MSDVRIKICGMTRPEDIALVNRLGVDMAGFVLFFPKSRRNLDIDRAAELLKELDGVKAVAVTVSPTPEQAEQIQSAGFDYLQIHGELYEETYNCCKLPMIRAFNDFNIREIERCARLDGIEYFLFDAAEPGSGKRCDRNALSQLPDTDKKLILAGGLTPDNVAHAIESVRPCMVDVSSGVELPQGGKDPVLAERFVGAVRAL